MSDELLDIVNEKGDIVGQAPRSRIHMEGLLHREIYVLFYSLKGDVFFQKRGAGKDTFPNLYDFTVGGHVDLGESPESAVIREVSEEVGLKVDRKELRHVRTDLVDVKDAITGARNHALQYICLYCYKSSINNLKVEDDGGGFMVMHTTVLLSLPLDDNRFKPGLNKQCRSLYEEILSLTCKA